jgi:[protein-PII] uridylyltransferase
VTLDYRPDRNFAHGIREMRGGFTEFILCTRDVHGLFANVAGVLTAHHMNILGAHVYTTRGGLALEIYRVATPAGDERARDVVWRDLLASLERVVRGDESVDVLLQRRGRPLGAPLALREQPPAVSVTNEESEFYTLVDVAANDRLGLLHDLTRVIAEHGYEIYISKAGKVLDQVTDTFYLKDGSGEKIRDAAAVEALRSDLLAALRTGGRRVASG